MKTGLVKIEIPMAAAEFIEEVCMISALGVSDKTAHMLVLDGYRVKRPAPTEKVN